MRKQLSFYFDNLMILLNWFLIGVVLKKLQAGTGLFPVIYLLVLIPAIVIWVRDYETRVFIAFRTNSGNDLPVVRTWKVLVLADIASLIVLLSFFYEGALPGIGKFLYLAALGILAMSWCIAAFFIGRFALAEYDAMVRGQASTREQTPGRGYGQ